MIRRCGARKSVGRDGADAARTARPSVFPVSKPTAADLEMIPAPRAIPVASGTVAPGNGPGEALPKAFLTVPLTNGTALQFRACPA